MELFWIGWISGFLVGAWPWVMLTKWVLNRDKQ